MYDTHCHLNYPKLYENLPQVLKEAQEAGVTGIVCVGTALVNLRANERALEIAKRFSSKKLPIWASVGVYPHEDTAIKTEKLLQQLETIISPLTPLDPLNPGMKTLIALGECGLDLNKTLDPADTASGMKQRNITEQQSLFEGQINLAQKHHLPLIVHSRNSAKETLAILKKYYPSKESGVVHSFTYSWQEAMEFIDLGFYIGINGIVTFNNAAALQEAVAKTPLECLLLETDAPYLSPEPFRGQTNTPARVKLVAEKVAQIKNTTFEKVVEITTQNAKKIFQI